MRQIVLLAMTLALLAMAPSLGAMFFLYQTQQAPIDRLFTNLQEQLARDTNNFELTYDLARLHSMAYSTNLNSIRVTTNDDRPQFYYPGTDSGVPRGVYLPKSDESRTNAFRHLTNAILLYQRAIVLLKKSTNATPYNEWLVLPLELGYAWCLDQAGARKEALGGYRKVLALAWKKEVTGEFDFGEWVNNTWNAVKAGKNPLKVTTRRGYIGPGVCFSDEVIGYMLNLLDPVKDANEIAQLRDKQKTLTTMGRAITPVLVPLREGAGLSELVDTDAEVTFDLDGSGLARKWGWITPKAAWLVFDPNGTGQVTSALQTFGNCTFWIFWHDGYEALRSLDDDGDGVLQGSELRGIALWQDRNGNGVSEPGEVKPVTDFGITAISCTNEIDSDGVAWSPSGVTFADGKTRPTYDWTAPGKPGTTEKAQVAAY